LKADREDSVNVVSSLSERALLDLRESADDDASGFLRSDRERDREREREREREKVAE